MKKLRRTFISNIALGIKRVLETTESSDARLVICIGVAEPVHSPQLLVAVRKAVRRGTRIVARSGRREGYNSVSIPAIKRRLGEDGYEKLWGD